MILANNRLFDQTRRDAQTKAVLLRELHHRVKNNLAGIVGLLSMNDPQLPPGARRWLDRAVARIQAMGAAHEVFGGTSGGVLLDRLIERVVPSLSVIKPTGVQVSLDLCTGAVELTTSQAVGLAMALHELCTNAIVHGLAENGTLLIRARRSGEGMEIEVSDDGRGIGGAEALAGSGGGTGLMLVRELVARELNGTFDLRTSPEGGTTATIHFPVDKVDSEGGSSHEHQEFSGTAADIDHRG